MDEYDVEEPLIQIIDTNTLMLDARTPIDEINEQMELELPEEEFDTIGGLVFGLLGKQPQLGDKVGYDGVELYVEETDGRRIEKIKLIKLESTLFQRSEAETEE